MGGDSGLICFRSFEDSRWLRAARHVPSAVSACLSQPRVWQGRTDDSAELVGGLRRDEPPSPLLFRLGADVCIQVHRTFRPPTYISYLRSARLLSLQYGKKFPWPQALSLARVYWLFVMMRRRLFAAFFFLVYRILCDDGEFG